jgi:hypothetical protein
MVYGVLGAAFMTFLGVTLLLLLNSRRITEGRSGWLSNLMLTAVSAPLRGAPGHRDRRPPLLTAVTSSGSAPIGSDPR